MLRTLGTEDDWPLWRELRLASFADAPEAFVEAPEEWAHGGEAAWRERLLDPDALAVVAVEEGEGVGLARSAVEDGSAWLHSLWVDPSRRGLGVAERLVEAVEEWARARATRITLDVVPDNARAIALYTRLGYVPGPDPGEPLPGGGNELRMVKQFDD